MPNSTLHHLVARRSAEIGWYLTREILAFHISPPISKPDPEPLIHPNLAEIYRTKIENLSSLLDDPECKTEAFDIIRGLIDDVRLVPEKGNLSVELKGELAGILSLCDTKQKPATSYEERAEQIKMVAGAHNRCYLHLDYALL